MSFFDVTQVVPSSASLPGLAGPVTGHDYRVVVPDGWQQGAGAFGGFVLALLVRAVGETVPGRTLRSLTAEIPAPANVGPATVSVEILRAGLSVTVAAARLTQEGKLLAHAVATLGAPRPGLVGETHVDLKAPAAPDWRQIDPIPADVPLLPTFARHFEYRLVDGRPFEGGAVTTTTGWIGARDPGPSKDAALVVAHADAWWPAEYRRQTAPRLMVTAAFTLQMIGGPDAWTSNAPLLHASRTLASRDGYVTELRELWTEGGELVALNEQTLVIIK